jgi:hypothetical protein
MLKPKARLWEEYLLSETQESVKLKAGCLSGNYEDTGVKGQMVPNVWEEMKSVGKEKTKIGQVAVFLSNGVWLWYRWLKCGIRRKFGVLARHRADLLPLWKENKFDTIWRNLKLKKKNSNCWNTQIKVISANDPYITTIRPDLSLLYRRCILNLPPFSLLYCSSN